MFTTVASWQIFESALPHAKALHKHLSTRSGVSYRFHTKEGDMADKITLVVRFRMNDSAKQEFTAKLQEVFTHIVKEETFVEASLVQDMRDPESILNYEVWKESPESFMKNQMTKAYRAEFEKMIVDLKIDRTPAWYSTIADWKRA
jgi:quinol monooxygenase YgiN